jgi:hypothetical protein
MAVRKLTRSKSLKGTAFTRALAGIVKSKPVKAVAEAATKENPRWVYFSRGLEPIIKLPVIFAFLGIYQGVFTGNAIAIPSRLEKLFANTWFRFFSLFLIALQSTAGDIENALLSTLLFLIVIYVMKSPEEKKKSGFI